MIVKLALLLAAIVGFVLLRVAFNRRNKEQKKRLIWQIFLYGCAGAILYMVITGRIHALFTLLGALIPWLQGGSVFAPLVSRLFGRKNLNFRTALFKVSVLKSNAGAQLDIDIISGSFTGRKLASLNAEELEEISQQCQDDQPSVYVLKAFLKQRNNQGGPSNAYSQPLGSDSMTVDMACEILELNPKSLSTERINRSYKRLMKQFHPDKGGHAYFATLLNLAKDSLIKHLSGTQ